MDYERFKEGFQDALNMARCRASLSTKTTR